MSAEVKLTVSALVTEGDRDMLMVQEGLGGLYNLPGGCPKRREALLDAVVRETFEESGLEVRPDFIVGLYQCVRNMAGNNLTRIVVACTQVGGELTVSEKHPDVGYFDLKKLRKMGQRGELQNGGLVQSIEDFCSGQGFGLSLITQVRKHKKVK